MTTLVTGASGFVGCALVEHLSDMGEEVLAADVIAPPQGFEDHIAAKPGKARFVRLDIADPEAIDACLSDRRVRHVVHGATITAGPERDRTNPVRTIDVNLGGTVRLLHALRDHPVERVVHVSSGAAYGGATEDADLLHEDLIGDPSTIYEITKFAGERMALRLGALHGIDVRIARLATVFGTWERATGARDTMSPMLQVFLAARQGLDVVLPGPITRDWIYSRDAAAGIVAIASMTDPGAPGVFNVGPGPEGGWSVLDWGRKLAERFPGFVCRLAGEGETPVPVLDQSGSRPPFAIERLMTHTDYRPRFSLDAAFEDFLCWSEGTGADLLQGKSVRADDVRTCVTAGG